MRVSSLLGALVAPFLLIACATAALPSDLGNGDGDAGVVSGGDSGYGSNGDGSTSNNDSGTGNDTGSMDPDTGVVTPVDSGPVVVDSGPTTLHGGDCTGTNSSQTAGSYDKQCDAYYIGSGFNSAPCTPGGTSCAIYNGMAGYTTFCCHVPTPGSFCDDDYFGEAQCVPE